MTSMTVVEAMVQHWEHNKASRTIPFHPSMRCLPAARVAIMEHRVSTQKQGQPWRRVNHTETILTAGNWRVSVQHGENYIEFPVTIE